MQHSRIQEKWSRVEKKILKDHLDAGKSAIEFRKWLEAMEDPKPKINRMDPKTRFRISRKEWD